MTWGEFKRLVETHGVREDDEIFSLEVFPDAGVQVIDMGKLGKRIVEAELST